MIKIPFRQFFLSIGFFCATFSSLWYYLYMAENTPHIAPSPLLADMEAEGIEAKQFDAKGNLVRILTASHMWHIPHHDKHIFQNPVIALHDQEPDLHIKADRGYSVEHGKHVVFKGHVRVDRAGERDHKPVTMESEKLVYYPKEKKVDTDAPLQIKESNRKVTAVGMVADLQSKQVDLLHQVHAYYY